MDTENEEKPAESSTVKAPRLTNQAVLVLRVLALAATVAAAVVMALNKQTQTLVVATVGTTPIKATLTAKFSHTPAFVFFVIANGMVGLHNLLMILVDLLGSKVQIKGVHPHTIAIFDMLNVALVSGGANAAVFMAELGKNGNKHARWGKICDKFGTYCDHGGGALIASFVGVGLMLVISLMTIFRLVRPSHPHPPPPHHTELQLV